MTFPPGSSCRVLSWLLTNVISILLVLSVFELGLVFVLEMAGVLLLLVFVLEMCGVLLEA
jgi:hypothetical protein